MEVAELSRSERRRYTAVMICAGVLIAVPLIALAGSVSTEGWLEPFALGAALGLGIALGGVVAHFDLSRRRRRQAAARR